MQHQLTSPLTAYEIGFWDGLRPEPIMTVSQWADRYRYLVQKASAEPGKWKTSRTPYLREIMDCLSTTSPIEEVIFMKGSQIGGSETGNNFVGYTIDHAPGPMMMVQSSIDTAKRYSKQRIDPLIESSDRLREKIKPARERDSGNNVLSKDFADGSGILLITGSNSAAGLRSMPIKKLFLDEEDSYPGDVEGEGDPVELAKARTRTFKGKKKILRVSTPTDAGTSRIAAAFLEGDQRRYYIPCPQCGHKQTLKWSGITWDKTIKDVDKAAETAHYVCEENGCVIEDHQKDWFLAEENGAEWIAEAPENGGGKVRSYHLSSLYSPHGWYSWQEAVKTWLKAQGNDYKLKTFTNTVLGEVWTEKSEAPEWRRLYERREGYKLSTVPYGALFLTCGVDVQKDRLEAQVVGWGRDKSSWVVDYIVFPGDTSDLSPKGPWVELDRLLQKKYSIRDDFGIPIRMMAVDSGYRTQTVYDWVRKYPANRVVATKGQDHLKMLFSQPKVVDINVGNGKKIRRGVKVWPIGSSMAKVELYGQLRLERPTESEGELFAYGYPPGYIHFSCDLDEEYFKQLTAESLVKRVHKGFARYDWDKNNHERNEALDTFILARVAASMVGMDRWTQVQWEELDMSIQPTSVKAEHSQDASSQSGNEEEIPRKKSKFWQD